METEKPIEGQEYLSSPKQFNLETPLYLVFDLAIGMIAEKIYKQISYSGTIDAFCIWCEKESVFDTVEHVYGTTFSIWKKEDPDFLRNTFRCSRNAAHKYYIYFWKTKEIFVKIGQYPSVADFQIPQAEKYRKILGEEEYKELTKGIGLAAHGVGIGSFVYLRRIFENRIDEAYSEARNNKKVTEEEYVKARMDQKIELLKNYLPLFLVENKNLYGVLSKGIHELSEKECLKYFEAVKIGIEQILDEKIELAEKKEKAEKARQAIQGVYQMT
ncbi:MAG: short-chain dehydrogenase [bacterium]|nr:short-chain dehydrogenase [bacterium]